jgi:alpha-galactosidase
MSTNPALFDIPIVVAHNRAWAEAAFSDASDAPLPFSFVYGGTKSADFLAGWKRKLVCEDVDATKTRRTLTLTDPGTGLQVRAEATIYLDTPGVDWTLHFINTGTTDTPILEKVCAVDVTAKSEDDSLPVLHMLRGTGPALMASRDCFRPVDVELLRGAELRFAPSDGRSSDGPAPFMNLQWNAGGVFTAIGWTGQWIAEVGNDFFGELHLTAGMEHLHVCLQPGETIRSPRILQLWWQGGDHVASYNLFRRTMFAHILPRIAGQPVLPPIAYPADYLDNVFVGKSSAEGMYKALKFMPEMGYDTLWVDACWMRKYGMGDYGFPIERVEARDRFPAGMGAVGEAAHKAGMKFILWFSPEDILPETYLVDEHPEWIIYPGIQKGAPDENRTGYGMFDLSIPEAREFMTRYLKTVIKEYHMDCLRVDRGWFGGPLPCWQIKDGNNPNRIGMSEMRGVEGLYRMWDDILAEYPDVYIDNCAGGGRRVDLETCARSVVLCITDHTAWASLEGWRNNDNWNLVSIQNQVMLSGLSRFLPIWATGVMFTTPYQFRSAFTGGISAVETDPPAGMEPSKALYTAAIAEAKRIRHYYWGDFYPLNRVTTDPADWCVVQYHLPAQDAGLIVAFRRHEAPEANFTVKPYAIDPTANYELRLSPDFEHTTCKTVSGAELSKLNISIEDCPGSLLVEYEKVAS